MGKTGANNNEENHSKSLLVAYLIVFPSIIIPIVGAYFGLLDLKFNHPNQEMPFYFYIFLIVIGLAWSTSFGFYYSGILKYPTIAGLSRTLLLASPALIETDGWLLWVALGAICLWDFVDLTLLGIKLSK